MRIFLQKKITPVSVNLKVAMRFFFMFLKNNGIHLSFYIYL